MKFDSDPTKQAQENIQQETIVSINPAVYFNNTPVNSTHKHLRMMLHSKLSYENHLKFVFGRVNKTIDLLRKLQPTLQIKSQVTICKSYIRPLLDYADLVFDQALNKSCNQSLEIL